MQGVDVDARRQKRSYIRQNTVRLVTTGCWIWQLTKDPKGYGVMEIGKRSQGVHRVSYRLWRGSIPRGLVIHHACERPSCVNPAHLEAVTSLENTAFASPGSHRKKLVKQHSGNPKALKALRKNFSRS